MVPRGRDGPDSQVGVFESLGSNPPDRALGLLKNELRRLGSLVIACTDRTSVPAGDALAVNHIYVLKHRGLKKLRAYCAEE